MSSALAGGAAPAVDVPQKPRLRILPQYPTEDSNDEAGKEAIRYAHGFGGMDLFPWQKYAVIDTLRERWVEDPLNDVEGGMWRWASTDVGILVARQNGKGDVVIVIALYCLFVLKVRRIFWTAQLQKTATDAHKRMSAIIRSSTELESQLAPRGIRSGKGDERIVTAWGAEILFFTRSDDAGKGLYGDVLILDEAYDLTDGELAALRPLLKTSINPLVIYTSTPVDEDAHPNGMVLARVRKRALTGRTARLTWLEWSVPEWDIANGPDPRTHDPVYLARGNPSLTYLFGLETLEDDLTSMGRRKFLVEDLCAPDFWPDPDADDIEDVPFPDTKAFGHAQRPDALLLDPVALGLDRSPGGWTTLTAAGWYPDGTWGSETIRHMQGDTGWVVGAIRELVDSWGPAVLVVDGAGPAGSLVAPLRAEGFDPIVTGPQEMGQASQHLVDDYDGGRYFHRGTDLPLNAAVEIVRWRTLGDARAFARKGFGDISPVVAAALAGYGLMVAVVFGKPKRPAEATTPVPVGQDASGGADWRSNDLDAANVGF